MTVIPDGEFEELCRRLFGADSGSVIEVLRLSPNARGYLLGSLSEVLARRELVARGYELERIREKWVGRKLHHGDYYVRRGTGGWFVLECKGLKSNSEKWHKVSSYPTEPAALEKRLRRKKGEFKRWWESLPPQRRKAILASGRFPQARILETHFVSGTGGRSQRSIATPRKAEFHVVAVDLFIRTGRHEFIYASAADLESPAGSPDHLKQNYLIDITVPGIDSGPTIRPPWTRDFDGVFGRLRNPVSEADRQVDLRRPEEREGELVAEENESEEDT